MTTLLPIGLHEMRGHLSNTLPNPRLISTTLTTNHSVPEKNHTILTALWGLLVYHDVSFTPVRGMGNIYMRYFRKMTINAYIYFFLTN